MKQFDPVASRVSVVRAEDRENLWFMGDLIQPIITTQMTEGRFQMSLTHAKAESEPPLHEHDAEDEIFYILEGSVAFWAGGEHVVLGPHDCILMPKDVPHIFRASKNVEAKWLVLSAPGGLDEFFRDVSEPATYLGPKRGWEMDAATEERLDTACRKHNITLLDSSLAEKIKRGEDIDS